MLPPSMASASDLLTLSNLHLANHSSKSIQTPARGTTAHWPAEFGVEIMVVYWMGECLAVEAMLVVFGRILLDLQCQEAK